MKRRCYLFHHAGAVFAECVAGLDKGLEHIHNRLIGEGDGGR